MLEFQDGGQPNNLQETRCRIFYCIKCTKNVEVENEVCRGKDDQA